ncbi:MAG: TrkH family potassium uptake protein [Clostridia bacterium]|nr:TrkH family potassium uptake protein [Clostridia bacterium]
MNYKLLGKILGKILIAEGLLMMAPLLIAIIYADGWRHTVSFLVPIFVALGAGASLQLLKPKRTSMYQKEGFALVAISWVAMALIGAIPFVINGDIPNYIDAIFEIMSGFTTTGASIITDITLLSPSSLFWRSFSHWIGGMGILAFVLIFIPESNDGSAMHLLRAESPGPQVGKIASKMKITTGILYLIYTGLTVLLIIILSLDKPVAGYEDKKFLFSMLTAFGCAGTGGFGFLPGSMELMSPFSQYVIAIFLLIFGCNFSLYYLILIGKVGSLLRSEEFKTYIIVIAVAIAIIFASLMLTLSECPMDYTTEEAFRHSLFQVATIMTTTGFSTTDFNLWPTAASTVLVILMLFGAMAGSTAGGMKLSRLVIAFKGAYINVRKLINPRYVPKAKCEGKTLEEKTINDVFSFITLYFLIIFATVLVLSFDPVCGNIFTVVSDGGEYTVEHGMLTNITAAIACISNIGPGLEAVGPYASYAAYSPISKILLSLVMLIGRLEILPVLILFSPKTWKRV